MSPRGVSPSPSALGARLALVAPACLAALNPRSTPRWRQELRRPHENAHMGLEGAREAHEGDHAEVDAGTLDALDRTYVETSRLGQFLLGEPHPSAKTQDVRRDAPKNVGVGALARHPNGATE